jgi:hypothetical protein
MSQPDRGRIKICVESSHKALGSLTDHAARGSVGDFLTKLADAKACSWNDSVDLSDDFQRQATACPARTPLAFSPKGLNTTCKPVTDWIAEVSDELVQMA